MAASRIPACGVLVLVALKAPEKAPLCWRRLVQSPARCRSSVVENSLGKGEVVCSIHTGSTIFNIRKFCVNCASFGSKQQPLETICQDCRLTCGEHLNFVFCIRYQVSSG